MNSCQEEGVRNRNRADPARSAGAGQVDSGREHPPRAMTSSETGHCYSAIDDSWLILTFHPEKVRPKYENQP
eukprot:gene14027-biopygen3816